MRTDIKDLAESLTGYQTYLENSCEKQIEWQRLPRPVRQVSDAITVTYHSPGALSDLSVDEKLDDRIGSEGAYIPVTFSEGDILGKSFSNSQRYRFLKSLKIAHPLDVLKYDPGGGAHAVVIMWSAPTGESESNHATQDGRLVKSLQDRLPEVHTRHMRKEFFSKYGQISGLSPATVRAAYFELTGNAATSSNPEMDRRVQLYLLGELPEIQVDLRRLNSCPEAYGEVSKVLQDWQAEDSRRCGVAHLSKFISLRDLHTTVSSRFPTSTLIPSIEWLRLQFLPTDPNSSSAISYTGKLQVKFAVQF